MWPEKSLRQSVPHKDYPAAIQLSILKETLDDTTIGTWTSPQSKGLVSHYHNEQTENHLKIDTGVNAKYTRGNIIKCARSTNHLQPAW